MKPKKTIMRFTLSAAIRESLGDGTLNAFNDEMVMAMKIVRDSPQLMLGHNALMFVSWGQLRLRVRDELRKCTTVEEAVNVFSETTWCNPNVGWMS